MKKKPLLKLEIKFTKRPPRICAEATQVNRLKHKIKYNLDDDIIITGRNNDEMY